MNGRILDFLKRNTNFTLATCRNSVPYCASCFYVHDEGTNRLVFKSRPETRHIIEARENRRVAGSIVPDKLDTTKIQGIQFEGHFFEKNGKGPEQGRSLYYSRYPFAVAVPGELWSIELLYIKMTDNTLGFGKKIEWRKQDGRI